MPWRFFGQFITKLNLGKDVSHKIFNLLVDFNIQYKIISSQWNKQESLFVQKLMQLTHRFKGTKECFFCVKSIWKFMNSCKKAHTLRLLWDSCKWKAWRLTLISRRLLPNLAKIDVACKIVVVFKANTKRALAATVFYYENTKQGHPKRSSVSAKEYVLLENIHRMPTVNVTTWSVTELHGVRKFGVWVTWSAQVCKTLRNAGAYVHLYWHKLSERGQMFSNYWCYFFVLVLLRSDIHRCLILHVMSTKNT